MNVFCLYDIDILKLVLKDSLTGGTIFCDLRNIFHRLHEYFL
jgi:hypothetical protein